MKFKLLCIFILLMLAMTSLARANLISVNDKSITGVFTSTTGGLFDGANLIFKTNDNMVFYVPLDGSEASKTLRAFVFLAYTTGAKVTVKYDDAATMNLWTPFYKATEVMSHPFF